MTPQQTMPPKGFDTIGSIAIIEVRKGIAAAEQRTHARNLLETHKHIHSVYKKKGGHEGVYRTQKLVWLAGKKNKETLHRENNTQLLLNVENCYFSPRLGTERARIANLVEDGEDVLVMFSGIGVYPIVIARNSGAKSITGIEINPSAHAYALQNITLNKVGTRVKAIHGDVRKKMPRQQFDRVIMPLPRGGESYLALGIRAVKKGGHLHFYDFLHEEEFHQAAHKVTKASGSRTCHILRTVKCGQQSPHVYRVCVDARIG